MVYDPGIGKLLLFGGQNYDSSGARRFLNDTWTYDGKTWKKQSPAHSPSPRSGAALAYDPAIGRLVLFGASEPVGSDTWTYDGKTWTQQRPATVPEKKDYGVLSPIGLSMAYDPVIGKLVLVGGETWTYDGTTWTKESPAANPPAWNVYPLTYDAALKRLVTYRVTTTGEATMWTYDGTTWTGQATPAGPPVISGWSLAYDPGVSLTILFGGVKYDPSQREGFGGFLNDTWAYDGRTWTMQAPATAPTPRSDALMQYDDALNSVVLFSGYGPQASLGGSYDTSPETWTYGPAHQP
jgi:hypothetical protein